MQINLDFTGYVAICTGGASGMGLLCGQKFAASGAKVVLCDVNEEAAKQRAEEICKEGGEAIGVGVDVRHYNEIEAAVNAAVERFGRVDYLVNAAGGASGRMRKAGVPFKDRDPEIIEWGLDVNLKGAMLFARAVINHMIAVKHGCIINFGSVTGEEGSAWEVDYSASKAGMHGLTKALAKIGAPYGVRCNCVIPGPVLTRAGMANMKTALGRAAEPYELVDFILYVCSDSQGSFMTGGAYLLDGGRLILEG